MISVSLFLGFSHLNSIFWVFVTFPVFFMKYKYETPLGKYFLKWSSIVTYFLQSGVQQQSLGQNIVS